MVKTEYLLGILKNILNFRISKLCVIDTKSKIHKSARLCRNTKIVNSSVGAYSYVAPKTQLVYANIGKFCSIGPNCNIGLPNHSINYLSTSPIFTSVNNATRYSWVSSDFFEEFHPITIGNDVWIGSGVIIMGGVKIGNGVTIGAGTIVTKDIPDYAVVVGVPGKVIKYRFDSNLIDKLLQLKWWDLSKEILRNKITIFQKENIVEQDLNKFLK